MKAKILLLAMIASLFMFGCGETEETLGSSGSQSEEDNVEAVEEDTVSENEKEVVEGDAEEQQGEMRCVRITRDGQVERTYEYDADGNLIKEVGYNSYDGTVSFEKEYAADGNLIKEINYTGESTELRNGFLLLEDYGNPYDIEYDADGNLVREVEYNYSREEINVEKEYEYDVNGNLIRQEVHDYSDEDETQTELNMIQMVI